MSEPAIITSETESGQSVIRIEGDLNLTGDFPPLRDAALHAQGTTVLWDLGAVEQINTIGAAALLEVFCELRSLGRDFKFLAISEPVHEMLALVPQRAALEKTAALRPPPTLFEHVGGVFYDTLDSLAAVLTMVANSLYWCFVAPFLGRGIKVNFLLQQVSRNGVDAIPIVSLIMFVIGFILALQADYQLRMFDASIYIADLVGVGLTRELGPLMVAVILAGRSGAAIAAEIGTMRVTEEIDALITMGMNPFKFLVAPRVLGLLISLPALTVLGNIIGILAAMILAVFYLDVPLAQYVAETRYIISLSDIVTGLMKSAAFALIIALVGCYQGYHVEGGPEEIGKATTRSVVHSLFLVIAADGFFTYIFYLFG